MTIERVGKTYFIQTYGCQQNENDSEILAGHLEQLGYIPCLTAEEADVVLFNTCSVREHADDRFFGNLGRLKQEKQNRPDMFIGVGGCILMQPQNQEKIMKSFPFVDLIFGTADLGRFPDLFFRAGQQRRTHLGVGPAEGIVRDMPMARKKAHRALVSIMYGCNNFCTYCIVPHTRGRERSRPKADILKEINDDVAAGYQEIMLLGQNVNSYGKDKKGEYPDFAELLSEAADIPGLFVIRFMSSHPKDVSDRLIEVIATKKKVEPHFHLPLQAGSDRILQRMNRGYTAAQFLAIVAKLRAARPEMTITTDIIVGFPGESADDFAETVRVVEQAKFDAAFTFIYSPREGTPAASFPDRVEPDVVKTRYQQLTNLLYALALQSNESVVGQTIEVLITGLSDTNPDVLAGRAADNRLVHIPLPDDVIASGDGEAIYTNTVVRATVTAAGSFSIDAVLT